MTPSFYEIVELGDGDYALRRVDDDSAPLVRISFSPEARDMLDDRDLSVAKAMISAGIEAAGGPADALNWEDEDIEIEDMGRPAPTLH